MKLIIIKHLASLKLKKKNILNKFKKNSYEMFRQCFYVLEFLISKTKNVFNVFLCTFFIFRKRDILTSFPGRISKAKSDVIIRDSHNTVKSATLKKIFKYSSKK